MPSGITNNNISYVLRRFIIGDNINDVSNDLRPLLDDELEPSDAEFVATFTLSRFHNDLMVLAWDMFVSAVDM